MMGDAADVVWMERLISFAVLQQTAEYWALRPVVADRDGIWRWSTLEREFTAFGRPLARALGCVLNQRGFASLLVLRAFAAGLLWMWPEPVVLGWLFVSTLLIALRWRGTFNGGSDYMTIIVLGGLFAARWAGEGSGVARAALAYIALQACLSYFVAGVVKLKAASWRDGRALAGFLRVFGGPMPAELDRPLILKTGGWAILLFECSFPLVLTGPRAGLTYLAVAMAFHLANAYFFGLNRFLTAWLAAYPAVYWLSAQRW